MVFVTLVKRSEYDLARLSSDRAHGDQSEHRLIGQSIIDKIELDIENGVISASRLSELPSKEEQDLANDSNSDGHGLSMTVSRQGVRVTQPEKVNLDMPKHTQEFRNRFRLWDLALGFIQIRHPSNAGWASSSNTVWALHSEYIFGPDVMGRRMRGTAGAIRKTPDWDVIMGYEMALRTKAAEPMYKGKQPNGDRYCFESAMGDARKCERTRNVHFN